MPAWSEGHKPLEVLSEGSSPTSCVEAALSAPRKNTMSMRRESSEAALRKSASWQQVYPPPDDMWVVRQASRKPAVMKRFVEEQVEKIKREKGKDIWLFGGGNLFRSLLDAALVDTIEASIMPIILSEGVPLLPAGRRSPRLQLTRHVVRPSGIVTLNYEVLYGKG